MDDLKWFEWKGAHPIDEATKANWIRDIIDPARRVHVRADFTLSGDTMILAIYQGDDMEVFELRPVRSAYILGAGRETTEYPGMVLKGKG